MSFWLKLNWSASIKPNFCSSFHKEDTLLTTLCSRTRCPRPLSCSSFVFTGEKARSRPTALVPGDSLVSLSIDFDLVMTLLHYHWPPPPITYPSPVSEQIKVTLAVETYKAHHCLCFPYYCLFKEKKINSRSLRFQSTLVDTYKLREDKH